MTLWGVALPDGFAMIFEYICCPNEQTNKQTNKQAHNIMNMDTHKLCFCWLQDWVQTIGIGHGQKVFRGESLALFRSILLFVFGGVLGFYLGGFY